jgi:hypothetical protein
VPDPDRPLDGASRGTVWLDDRDVDPGWTPPPVATVDPRWAPPEPSAVDPNGQGEADRQPERPRRSRLVTAGVPVLSVLMIFATVWALGGFDRREDQVQDVAAGTAVVQGPLTLRFTRATVQEANGYGKYKRIQKVVAYGTARNTWTETFGPQGEWFIARDPNSDVVETGQLFRIERGEDLVFDAPDDLAPGLPPVPVSVEFELPPTVKPGRTIVLGVSTVDYGKHSYFASSDEESWGPDGGAYRMRLPLTVIKPEPQY